ncbi:MAG: type II secretion system F family protein [Gammaproteobacteria bacterium]
MAIFKYEARTSTGEKANGTVEAESMDDAGRKLIEKGLMPISVALQKQAGKSALSFEILPSKVKLDDLLMFCRQMYSMLKSGVPALNALEHIQLTTRSKKLKTILAGLIEDVSSGRNLSFAMAKYPDTFTEVFTHLIEAGESSGQMDAIFLELSNYVELEIKTKRHIKAATRYPLLVVTAVVIAITVINFLVIPAFSKMFEQLGSNLPLPTRIIIATSDFMSNNFLYILVGIILFYAWFRYWASTPKGRIRWAYLKLHMPIFGSIIYRLALGRFTRIFSMLLKSGVPLIQSITLVSHVVGNDYFETKLLDMRTALEKGDRLSTAAKAANLFDNLVLQMIGVGEQTGELDRLLGHISSFYEEEVEYDLQKLREVLEPIMLLLMAGLVLILALGIFLPIWNMIRVVG